MCVVWMFVLSETKKLGYYARADVISQSIFTLLPEHACLTHAWSRSSKADCWPLHLEEHQEICTPSAAACFREFCIMTL